MTDICGVLHVTDICEVLNMTKICRVFSRIFDVPDVTDIYDMMEF